METYIVHPQNKEQASALKAIFKALDISFTKAKQPYNKEWEQKMKAAAEDKKKGKYKAVKTADLWK